MIFFLDANIFLRVLTGDDKKQFDECLKLLGLLKRNKIEAYTNTVVLAEIAWTLTSFYGITRKKVIDGIKSIINIRGLKIIDAYNHLKALDLYEKYSVKFIDALIASGNDVINRKNVIVSYDRDFDKLPVIRQEPKAILKEITNN